MGLGEDIIQVENSFSVESDKPDWNEAVVLVNRLPYGLVEYHIKKFFSQFGKVLKVRLLRSKKTGGSKRIAFLQFETSDIARIVASCMNNYILFGVTIKCTYLPTNRVPKGVFDNYVRFPQRHFKLHNKTLNYKKKYNTEVDIQQKYNNQVKRYQKLKDMNIDYCHPIFHGSDK